jgi:hypothetical protein
MTPDDNGLRRSIGARTLYADGRDRLRRIAERDAGLPTVRRIADQLTPITSWAAQAWELPFLYWAILAPSGAPP